MLFARYAATLVDHPFILSITELLKLSIVSNIRDAISGLNRVNIELSMRWQTPC